MPYSVTTTSASARGVVTTPSASLATMREWVRSRFVDCSAMIDRPSGARLAARTKSICPTDQTDMPSCCGFRVYLPGKVDFERPIYSNKVAEIAEHQRIVGVRGGSHHPAT
jgi:hypothetical protein